jgi:hypothetical protein
MSRIPTPSSTGTSPAASRPLLLAAHGDELGAFDTHGRRRRPDDPPGLTERGL